MSRYIHRYGLDPTGKSLSNLVQNEVRNMPRRDRRAVVPIYGGFFAKSMYIRDAATNAVLKEGKHYVLDGLFVEPTDKFGVEINTIVIIIDPLVSDNIVMDYQVLGSVYEDCLPIILDLINSVQNDSRPTEYITITNKPVAFKPVRHMHDIGDIYGFEPLVHAVERARMLMELSSAIDYDGYYRYVDSLLLSVANLGGLLMSELIANHIAVPDQHPQYVQRTKIEAYALTIRKPLPVAPIPNAVTPRNPTFKLSAYYSMYRSPQTAIQVQVSKKADFSDQLAIDVNYTSPVDTYTFPSNLPLATGYYWRARYVADDGTTSDWSDPVYFTTTVA